MLKDKCEDLAINRESCYLEGFRNYISWLALSFISQVCKSRLLSISYRNLPQGHFKL